MRNAEWIRGLRATGLGLVLACGAQRDAAPRAAGAMPADTTLTVSLATDKARYAGGEPIALTLTVRNAGAAPVTLEFASGQRYDFTIEDASGRVVWRWGADQMFVQMLGEETVEPGGKLEYGERYAGPRGPGRYRVTGRVVALGRELVDTVDVTVGR